MKTYLNSLTPTQTEQASPDQKTNNAGGYVFTLTPLQRLRRFLILGSEGGTYYVGERALTRQNIENLKAVCHEFPTQAVEMISEVSDLGLAPRNTPAIFALAVAITTPESGRFVTPDVVKRVCRIGTHRLQLAAALKALGGWGRHKRTLLAHYYETEPLDRMAYDMAKYQQRDGWSQADLLRVCHPVTTDPERHAILRWALKVPINERRVLAGKTYEPAGELPLLFEAIRLVASPDTPRAKKLDLIRDYGLSREMVPTEMLTDPGVWEAMLPRMGTTAVIRNLRNMAKMGLLKPFSSGALLVMSRLSTDKLRAGRIHPVQVLQGISALENEMKYSDCPPVDGSLMSSLNAGFDVCFKNIRPANKRTLLALDVSGSMAAPCGTLGFSCSEGAAVMALATARTEPAHYIMGFADTFRPLGISVGDTLHTAMKKAYRGTFSGTDCSLPMLWAIKNKIDVDTFVVYTDNETWAGVEHPFKALQRYKDARGIDAKLVVVGMTATEFTIADPRNPGMLDVVGFDSSSPSVIADFSADRL